MAKAETATKLPRPKIDVLERSLANPFGLPSEEIKLTDPSVTCHWCNTGIGANQLGKYLDAGYLKVTEPMLADKDRVAYTISPEGCVTRGARHEEILLYTPRDWYKRRQIEKQKRNLKSMAPGATKAELVQAVGDKYGDEGANFVDGHVGPTGNVRDTFERIAVTPDSE